MLRERSNEVEPIETYYQDAFSKANTVGHSAFLHFANSFASPFVALGELVDPQFAKTPEGGAILSMRNLMNFEDNALPKTTGQGLVNWGADMAGFALNPAFWGLGATGGLAAKGVEKAAGAAISDASMMILRKPLTQRLPQALGKLLPETIGAGEAAVPLSVATIGAKASHAFTGFAFAGIPDAVINNYDETTGHIAFGGFARDAGTMGAMGIAIGTIPFTYGILRGKLNRGLGKAAGEAIADGELAKSGLSPDAKQWLHDYEEYKKAPGDVTLKESLMTRATKIAEAEGHKVNHITNEANFDFMESNDIQNMVGSISDQVASIDAEGMDHVLTDFAIHGRLDKMIEKPELLDGVRGYVDSVREKMAQKDIKLAEQDALLDKHFESFKAEELPLSQKHLFDNPHLRKDGSPLTVPDNIKSFEANTAKLRETIASTPVFDDAHFNETMTRLNKEIEVLKKSSDEGLTPGQKEQNLHYLQDELSQYEKLHGEYIKERKSVETQLKELKRQSGPKGKLRYFADAIAKLESELGKENYPDFVKTKKDIDRLIKEVHALKDKTLTDAERKEKIDDITNRLKIAKIDESIVKSARNRIAKKARAVMEKLSKSRILTPKEELQFLKKKLLGEKGLPSNLNLNKHYHRLQDLAEVWHNAKVLLDRVHLEHEYNRQEAYAHMADQIVRLSDSSMDKLAKPEDFAEYLQKRLQRGEDKIESLADIERDLEAYGSPSSEGEAKLSEQEAKIAESSAESMKENFNKSVDKYQEAKESEGILRDYINCELGI